MRLFLLLVFALSSSAFALSCSDTEGAFELELESLGIVYFQDVNSTNDGTLLTLFNGVCLIAKDGWQVESSEISVVFKDDNFFVRAEGIDAHVFDWKLQGARLEAFSDTLVLYDLNLQGQELSGSAGEARFDIPTGEISFVDVKAKTKALRVEGKSARLYQDTLVFSQAIATTCTCETDPIYTILADEASFSYETETLSLKRGQLIIGSLHFDLGDQELSQDTFADFSFPVTIEFSEDDLANNIRGTGLGLRIPNLKIDDKFSLELGLLGLDNDYDLRGVLLSKYNSETVKFVVGKNSFGPQADFSYTQALLPWLKANFSMLNRHWLEQDFSHDASLRLDAQTSLKTLGIANTSLDASLFAAASNQTPAGQASSNPDLNDSVSSARLGLATKLSYALADPFSGQWKSSLELKGTYYPGFESQQYGLIFNSQWHKNLSTGSSLQLGFDQTWTNSASPFTTKIDRLEPVSLLSASFTSKEKLEPDLTESFSFRTRYNFLTPTQGFSAFDDLGLSASLNWQLADWSVSPFVDAHFEGLINPNLSASSDAYLDTGLRLTYSDYTFGSKVRLDLYTNQLDSVELSSSLPFRLNDLELKPFIALDILPSLSSGELPRVTGHGLDMSIHTCCGILDLGYQQYNNKFATRFGIRFE